MNHDQHPLTILVFTNVCCAQVSSKYQTVKTLIQNVRAHPGTVPIPVCISTPTHICTAIPYLVPHSHPSAYNITAHPSEQFAVMCYSHSVALNPISRLRPLSLSNRLSPCCAFVSIFSSPRSTRTATWFTYSTSSPDRSVCNL